MLDRREIGNGLCPRDVTELSNQLATEEGFREGLKRRVGTEARIGIFKNVFLGRPLLAKGFKHRELAVGWAALTHNLWVIARMAKAEKKRKEAQEQNSGLPESGPPDKDRPLSPRIWTPFPQVRESHDQTA